MKWTWKLIIAILLLAGVAFGVWQANRPENISGGIDPEPFEPQPKEYVGAMSCRECHEAFYDLWAPSHHGLSMQPYTEDFAQANLTKHADFVEVDEFRYRAEIASGKGWMVEEGPNGNIQHPIAQVLGGKNTYYFLTPMEKGRLQTMPLAYDVNDKRWYDMAGSAVRHFADIQDEALDWRERPYTYNTSCYGCHVSQLSTNYDFETDTYDTTWKEPGINCETCHGPGSEHVRACQSVPAGTRPDDLRIIVTSEFNPEQMNSLCAPCHAKMRQLTTGFKPGEDFFDHYGLVTLEDRDFYPDGRDLGENYTYTLWRMSGCAKSGQLDCAHCHTPSGRDRFAGDKANEACLPCHDQIVENAAAHSNHSPQSEGNKCVACHMPMTRFAAMNRSDHSMRAPTPAATIEFESPNACNMCHTDQDASWANTWVKEWYERDYQAPTLHTARLIAAARKQEWDNLPGILEYIGRADRDEIVATSLIRLLTPCEDDRKWPVFAKAMNDPSPLIRASAAEECTGRVRPETIGPLLECLKDEYRLVRIRAASALAGIPVQTVNEEYLESLEIATAELELSLKSRPDDPMSHYNLGNFYMDRQEYPRAIASFENALKLQPDNLLPLINASIAYNVTGQNSKAEAKLRKAVEVEPANEAANLNLALLLAELGQMEDAETHFRAAFKANPKSAVPAYNLGVMLMADRQMEALRWCRKAHQLLPDDPKYAYTYGYSTYQAGDTDAAIRILRDMIDKDMPYAAAYSLLGHIYEEMGERVKALAVYREGMMSESLSPQDRSGIEMYIRRMNNASANPSSGL